jgi:hypothetical protein
MTPRLRLGTRGLLAAAALLGLLAATTAHATTSNNNCPALIGEGCTACTDTACTECRPFSAWSDAKSKCVCDAAQNRGTVSEDLFDAYVDSICNGDPQCHGPDYSTVANKCVDCQQYLNGTATEDGVCEQIVSVLDTKLTLINWIPDPEPSKPWNPSWLMVNMGQCEYGCGADPNYLQARTMKPGDVTTQQGWNALFSTDITADVTFCKDWVGKLEYKCSERNVVRIEAANPSTKTPFVTIGGIKKKMKVGEYWEVETGGHKFSARRNPDLDTAKDFIVAVLT